MKITGYGIEIGGPSGYFKDTFPVYADMAGCDNVNFSSSTVWGESGTDYTIDGEKVGIQYIYDTTNLKEITTTYDFVLTSNNIEHIANPMKAMREWVNLLKPGGFLVVVAPRKESNFDHNREITEFVHLLADYENNIGEDDLTHLAEILVKHDLSLDPPAGTLAQFTERSVHNFENRCLHHHVFDIPLLIELFNYFDITVIESIKTEKEYCVIGQKI